MAQEYRKRIDGLFETLKDERTRLEASDDIRALAGRIVVSPGADGGVDLSLEGDLAVILTLASGRITPADPRDGQALLSLVAGAGFGLCDISRPWDFRFATGQSKREILGLQR